MSQHDPRAQQLIDQMTRNAANINKLQASNARPRSDTGQFLSPEQVDRAVKQMQADRAVEESKSPAQRVRDAEVNLLNLQAAQPVVDVDPLADLSEAMEAGKRMGRLQNEHRKPQG